MQGRGAQSWGLERWLGVPSPVAGGLPCLGPASDEEGLTACSGGGGGEGEGVLTGHLWASVLTLCLPLMCGQVHRGGAPQGGP